MITLAACWGGHARPAHAPQIVPPRLDLAHVPVLPSPFSSSEHRPTGTCVVQVIVKQNGSVKNVSLSLSSGFRSIDDICLKGAQQVLFFPGTKDGKPFLSSGQISLIWQVDHWEFR